MLRNNTRLYIKQNKTIQLSIIKKISREIYWGDCDGVLQRVRNDWWGGGRGEVGGYDALTAAGDQRLFGPGGEFKASPIPASNGSFP